MSSILDSSCGNMSCITSCKKYSWICCHTSPVPLVVYGNAIKIPAEDTEPPYYLKGCYVRKRNMRVKRFKMISYTDPPWVYFLLSYAVIIIIFHFIAAPPSIPPLSLTIGPTAQRKSTDILEGKTFSFFFFFLRIFYFFNLTGEKNEHKKSSCSRR